MNMVRSVFFFRARVTLARESFEKNKVLLKIFQPLLRDAGEAGRGDEIQASV